MHDLCRTLAVHNLPGPLALKVPPLVWAELTRHFVRVMDMVLGPEQSNQIRVPLVVRFDGIEVWISPGDPGPTTTRVKAAPEPESPDEW